MYCPKCKSENIGVIDTRSAFKRPLLKNYRRRRYNCNNCGNRFSTIEFPVDIHDVKIVETGDIITMIFKKLGE